MINFMLLLFIKIQLAEWLKRYGNVIGKFYLTYKIGSNILKIMRII
jgi:hypothetical protein